MNQRRRRLAFQALSRGRHSAWDFEPRRDAAKLYARNLGVILGEREGRARLPYVGAPPPDGPGA